MISYTLDKNNYVNSFTKLGELSGAKTTTLLDFNEKYFYCYKEIEGELVWDEAKYQDKINPSPSEIINPDSILNAKIEVQTLNLLIELGVI